MSAIKPVTADAAGLLSAYVLPMLEQELVRLQSDCDRRKLRRDEMAKLVDLTRATVALRYVDIRVAEGERKAGKGAENLEGMTIEQLLAKAKELLAQQGLDVGDLRKLSAFRAGEKG